MKTIFDRILIQRIHENPIKIIGQRDHRAFEAYCMPFDHYRTIKNKELIEDSLIRYPSIREEIEQEFNIKLGTRRWTAPLRYISEDERDLYTKSINYMLDYDEKYSINIAPAYIIKTDRLSLPSILGCIGYRFRMYINGAELAYLRAFIDGYYDLKNQYNLPLTTFEMKLFKLIDNYRKLDQSNFKTWDRNYRWQWDFQSYGYSFQSIYRFLKEVEEYTDTKINPIVNKEELFIDWATYKQIF